MIQEVERYEDFYYKIFQVIGQDFKYGVASMQGWRSVMEDAHLCVIPITNQPPFKNWSFFAIFDGHAGNRVALHSSQHLLNTLLQTEEFQKVLLKSLNKIFFLDFIGAQFGFVSSF